MNSDGILLIHFPKCDHTFCWYKYLYVLGGVMEKWSVKEIPESSSKFFFFIIYVNLKHEIS